MPPLFRFRGFANARGQGDAQSLKYWQLQTARLAFVIVFEVTPPPLYSKTCSLTFVPFTELCTLFLYCVQ